MTAFTIPGLSEKDGNEVAELLQKQLSTYNDLHLTLKHIHWNVVGPIGRTREIPVVRPGASGECGRQAHTFGRNHRTRRGE
ncbi:hypothetical protein OKHIL_54870 [Mycolicibacterium mageritense]